MTARRTLIFAPETFNLAEVTRTLEIAKVARRSFDCVFTSYDGARRNHGFIERAGFPVRALDPVMTEEKIRRFWAVDRGEALGDILSTEDLAGRVRSELALYRELDPAAVITGFCLSAPLSARAARVPLVWLSQSTWLPEYARRDETWPDALDHRALRVVPDPIKDLAARLFTPQLARLLVRPFNRVARDLGLPPFRGHDLLESEHLLFCEAPGFSGLPIPARLAGHHRFVGPLIARLDVPIPEVVRAMPRDLPIIYFAMGSSGVEPVVKQIVEGFAGKPYRVIAPVAALTRDGLRPPPNVIVTDWLPADQVNPMAAVSVIHGGVGTVMTACASGTPIVGIANGLVEQEYNLDCVVRKGFAVRLRRERFTATEVLGHIERFLRDDRPRAAAQRYRDALAAWDGPERSARYLEETFG